jgi:hypothetical protein
LIRTRSFSVILVSAGLVLTAIVLLIAGFVLGQAFLVMWSIAISLLSAVFLVIGALLRRHELFPGGNAGVTPPFPPKGAVPAGPMPAPHMMSNQPAPHPPPMMVPRGMQQTATVATQPRLSPMAGPVPAARLGSLDAKAIVLVIPGRKRYHVAGCRQLVGREHEELTHEEAREEGFTPCTTCLPEFTAGTQPQDAPAGAQEPVRSLASSQESSSFDAAQEPGHNEPTSRFTSPYKPVASPTRQEPSPARQESPTARQETPSRHEAATPVARSYIQPPAARTHPQEPVSPPLRAEQPAAPSFSFLAPPIPEIPPAESEATSWFNRDAATPPEPGPEASANPESGPVEPGPSTESEVVKGRPVESGSPTAAETSNRSETRARSETSARPESAKSGMSRPETTKAESATFGTTESGSSKPGTSKPGTSKPGTSKPGTATPGTAKAESATSGTAKAESSKPGTPESAPAKRQEAPEASSTVKQEAPASSASAEPADGVVEPMEPDETAPGRAGQPVPADSSSAESAAATPGEAAERSAQKAGEKASFRDRDDDTSPGGIPIIREQSHSADPETRSDSKRETVKVIVGTSRFHDSTCPLIKGMGGSGVETMPRSEAEEAGLSSCPVCLGDN